ncbi:MAG: hypothetical protein J7K20_05345 [Thermodesulfobacterium sp.]|nr:hypothetical protein [Thermodesulfobacterium sp.]
MEKMYRVGIAIFLIFLFLSYIFLFISKKELIGAEEVKLSDADCVKCHKKEPSLIESKGGKHKTKVGCLDCHKGHYPSIPKEKMIPACSECHKGKPHYTLENCLRCHSNPHAPLEMDLAKGEFKAECISCHEGPGKELAEYPSKHSFLYCNTCHIRHGFIPDCLKCHKPHLAEQTFDDCKSCHGAHKPLKVTYGMNVPNKYCIVCHPKLGEMLNSTTTKHKKLACAFCHRGRHRIIPDCSACHGSPHPQAMVKGKKCIDCHIDAHALVK